MRNLVLVTLVLQLLLTLTEAKEEFQFGDLISFGRMCILGRPSYKHFAVYVGDVDFPGKQAGQDIFQRTGGIMSSSSSSKKDTRDCGFGVLAEGVGVKDNYLDEYFAEEIGTAAHRAQMIERIKYWNNPANCGTYNLRKNNCEHLATHVRYNITICQQRGTTARHFCKRGLKTLDCGEIYKLLKDMEENERRREECYNKSSSSVNKPLMIALSVCALLVCAVLLVVGYLVFRKRSRGRTPPVNYVDYASP